ncbi:MAG: glycosyltransferase family 4 protein [Moorea sp. SIO4G2]|nr:glycosyltransferase family 4 protein [Moorena sp. SIO4G2]
MNKLAIISSHPIQYYAPWFRYITCQTNLVIKVFYLWNFGVTEQIDAGFQQSLQWDIPLLNGYDYEFVPNVSTKPGTNHFWGLNNPSLATRVAAFEPDAVLLMNYNYASLYRFLWQWKTHQAPLMFRGDSHRLLPQVGIKAWARQKFITQIYRRFAALLYVGKANHAYFTHHRISSEQLFFSPHAVDNERFFSEVNSVQQQAKQWKQSLGIPQTHQVILFAGKLSPKKRPLDLFQAFCKARLNQVSLLFVGAGSLETQLKKQANQHPQVFFAPVQNQTMMPRTYAAADIVVLPSYGSGETWGLAINEAMCLSKPVIVSSHVGCAQDLVSPYENGLIFPAGNIPALTHSLQEAFSNPQRLQAWGAESRRIISNYSYSQATAGLQQALKNLAIK